MQFLNSKRVSNFLRIYIVFTLYIDYLHTSINAGFPGKKLFAMFETSVIKLYFKSYTDRHSLYNIGMPHTCTFSMFQHMI